MAMPEQLRAVLRTISKERRARIKDIAHKELSFIEYDVDRRIGMGLWELATEYQNRAEPIREVLKYLERLH